MEYEQPVYFIGIALPPILDKMVSDLKWQFYEQDPGLLKPLLPHVTLLSPPSLQGIMPDELLPRVHEVASRYLPLTLACEEVNTFGKNVSYIAVRSQSLRSLQSRLIKLLPAEAREKHYRRAYMPHITIAQAYEPHELDVEMIHQLTSAALELPQQFTVDSLSYFKRILPREYRANAI